MRATLALLAELNRLLPPTGPARHNLTLREDGRLHLYLMVGPAGWQSIYLEDSDLDKDPVQLAAEIMKLYQESWIKEPLLPNEEQTEKIAEDAMREIGR